MDFDPDVKVYVDGTHRARSPEETLEHFRPAMKACGITRLANITGLDRVGIPVFTAVRPRGRLLSTSQGKGASNGAAAASAMMEAIEVWHAENVSNPTILATQRELLASGVPHELDGLPRDPAARAHPDARREWVEGLDLVTKKPVWVPRALVELGPFPALFDFFPSTNGLASGNTRVEAILHGLYEVIERDARHLARVTGSGIPILLEAVEHPLCRAVLGKLRKADLRVAAWDVTSDIGVPCYEVMIADRVDGGHRRLTFDLGSGCHLVPEIALLRALTEAAQARLTIIAGNRDDMGRQDHRMRRDLGVQTRFATIFDDPRASPFWKRESLATAAFTGDLAQVLHQLARAEVTRVIVVDLAKPHLGVPVVKVFVPGLEQSASAPGARLRAALRRSES